MNYTTLLVIVACFFVMLRIAHQTDVRLNLFDIAGNVLVVILVAYVLRL